MGLSENEPNIWWLKSWFTLLNFATTPVVHPQFQIKRKDHIKLDIYIYIHISHYISKYPMMFPSSLVARWNLPSRDHRQAGPVEHLLVPGLPRLGASHASLSGSQIHLAPVPWCEDGAGCGPKSLKRNGGETPIQRWFSYEDLGENIWENDLEMIYRWFSYENQPTTLLIAIKKCIIWWYILVQRASCIRKFDQESYHFGWPKKKQSPSCTHVMSRAKSQLTISWGYNFRWLDMTTWHV